MLKVFLSHSSKDKPFVRRLAEFLERGGEIKPWVDEAEIAPGDNIVLKIEEGLETTDFVLLILSPDSVRSKWVDEERTAAIWDQTNSGSIRVIPVLYRDCKVPALLRNKMRYDLRTNELDGFAQIKTWLLTQRTAPPPPAWYPDANPLFVGREGQLTELRDRLSQPGAVVPVIGMGGLGKTTLAREFVHRHASMFEAVHWLRCEGRDAAGLAGELSRQLGVRLDGDLEAVLQGLNVLCSQKRLLLVLDNAENEDPSHLLFGGRVSVLVTTRLKTLAFLALRQPVELAEFTDDECLEVFRKVLGEAAVSAARDAVLRLCARLGRLPIAVAVAAGLVKHDVRYTIPSLADTLPPLDKLAYGQDNVGRLFAAAIGAAPEFARCLLNAAAVCAPGSFRMGLAATVAGLDESASLDAMQDLYARSLAQAIDREKRRYRLHALVRAAAGASNVLARRHAELVRARFETWEEDWRECEDDLEDVRHALDWVLRNNPDPECWAMAFKLGYFGFRLTKRRGRLPEAFDFADTGIRTSNQKGDRAALQAWYGNQALILLAWGRLEEALSLFKKQEAICEELGHRDGLATCYGNQAVILQSRGRLEDALALLKKQEAICEALRNREGLSRSYGNQALILKARGRLEEALELLKKHEAICEELGNRDGLQASYGNQAGILQAWGRLEEALVLYHEKESICEALGNRDGLQQSYGSQAVILKARGRLDEAMALHKKEEAICEELGNRDGLQRTYGNQALILQEWGRLAEALSLHKRKAAICEELGNREGLSTSYGNQAGVLGTLGQIEEALALLKSQEAICEELGNREGLAYCYWSLAVLAINQHSPDEARARAEQSLAIFRDLKMQREIEDVERLLARINASGAAPA